MPYKSIEIRRLKQKLQKQQKRSKTDVSPIVSPIVSPDNPFMYDIMRFELLFDTIRMQELLLRKTRFNVWMNYHLSVLEELQIYFNKK